MKKNLDFKLLRVFFALHTYPAKSSAGRATTMVTEVKLHCFHGRGSTTVMEVIFFLPFLNEFGNSYWRQIGLNSKGRDTKSEAHTCMISGWGIKTAGAPVAPPSLVPLAILSFLSYT